MNCSTCRVNKIGPEINPFGGYFCSNEHLQCDECNNSAKGHCGLCHASTKFIQMNFNSPKSSVEPLASTVQSSMFSKNRTAFSKQIFEEIETQSRLSKERLSMKDSRESLIQNGKENSHVTNVLSDVVAMESRANEMETLFIGTPADKSVSLIGNSIPQSNNKLVVKKENVFLFENNPNDTYIPTSEIRFMDSTESFKNFYTITKTNEIPSGSINNNQQMNSLSLKVLCDFETQNSLAKTEIVKNYLENCSPRTYQQPPIYNCQHSHCQFGWQPSNHKLKTIMKTVSVSTDSDPSLKSTCLDTTEAGIVAKFKPRDYLVMQAVGVSPPVMDTANLPIDKNSMDMRMQKILETLKEDVKATKFIEKSDLIKVSRQVPAKQQLEKQDNEARSHKKEDQNYNLVTKLLNTHRAVYNPPNPPIAPVNNLHLLPEPQTAQQAPPSEQFQTVPCSSALAEELLRNQKRRLSLKPIPACVLNIPRTPIQCPESTCQRMIFVSGINKHFDDDHAHLPMERIIPYQCKNFFLDARLVHCGTSKCHLLYLMRDKITDLGSSKYKDFLPILVMSTRISLSEMCGLRDKTSTLEFFLIWVTGIVPDEFPISVSLTVWSRSGKVPSCHIVYSGQMYSIRESQCALDVWQSGRMLLLSDQEIDILTCGGKEMLNLQLSVH